MRALAALALIAASSLAHAPAHAASLDDIRQSGVLKVCIVPNYAGISLRDPRTGQLGGFDIDMSKRLAAQMRARAQYVETDYVAFPEDLSAGRCHIAMMGIWVTRSRAQRADFSQPYFSSDAFAITARGNRRLQSWDDVNRPQTLMAVVNSPELLFRARQIVPNATIAPLTPLRQSGRESPAAEVMAGRADVFLVDRVMAKGYERGHTWARVISPPQRIALTEIAYAVPKGDAEWLSTVNDFIARSREDGSLLALARQHGFEASVRTD
ncbi:MAG: transporter substrate-binding domain-containing protein [Sinobacteraceae bacterium]|nr:transporter substrate-binding domain-containing protein [Nevskiaceae bacterium]